MSDQSFRKPNFYRIRLGRKGSYISEALSQGFIGVNFDFTIDLSGEFPNDWRQFNQRWRPWLMERNPSLSGVAAGLGCGMTWVLGKGILEGDIVLCLDEYSDIHVAEVTGPYQFAPEGPLPHRRPVRWLTETIPRDSLSEELWRGIRGPSTLIELRDYRDEITLLLKGGTYRPAISVDDVDVESPMEFAFESHLEDFIVENWTSTIFGADYDLYNESGESGTQIQVTGGRLDILAVRKDGKELLVIELKRGRASDYVVGQMLRYMSLVSDELATSGQSVRGGA